MRRAGREALAAAWAVSGLLGMRWAGFAVPVWATVVAGVGATAALAVLPAGRRPARVAVVVAAAALVGLTGAALAGVWIAVALVLADAVLRGDPGWPRLSGAHPSVAVPITVLLAFAAWRADETSYRLGPAPFVLGAALAVVAGVSIRSSWRAYGAWAAGAGLLHAAAATRGHLYNLAAAVSPELLSALALAAWSAHLEDRAGAGAGAGPVDGGGRWAPWRSLGPLVAAVPALGWWMVNVAILVTGEWRTDRHGWGAWDAFQSTLPERFNTVNAVVGIPAVLVGLVVGGAYVAVLGRRGARAIGLGVGAGTAIAAAIATTWPLGWS
jgi:hypothetical protein